MTDGIQTDKLKADEASATGWVKTHIAWTIGLGCLLVGFVAGYVGHSVHI